MEETTSTPKMKTATIIFVALTVFSGLFLESSSAPNLLGIVVGGGSQNSLGELAGGLVKKVLVAVENLIEVIFDKLTKLLAGVKPEIKEPLKGLLEKLKTIVIELRDAIKNLDVGDILKNLNLLKVVVKKIHTVRAQLLEKYGNDASLKLILDKIGELVNNTVTEVFELVQAVLKQLVDEIANGIPERKEFVAGLIKTLDKAIAEASEDKVKELLTKTRELVYELMKQIVKLINALLEAITTQNLDKHPSLVAGCKSNMAELKQLCVHTDLPDIVQNIVTKVIELLEDPVSKLEGISCIIEITVLGKILKEVEVVLGELPAGTTELGELFKELIDLERELLIAHKNGNIVDVQKFEGLIYKVIKTIKTIVAKLFEKLGGEAKEKLEQVLEKVLKALNPIFKELFNGVKDISSKLAKDLAGILKKLEEAIADATGELKELLIKTNGLLKELLEKLLDLIKAVVALLVNFTDESLNKLNGLLKAIDDILLPINGILESESARNAIGQELVGLIVVFVSALKEVLVNINVLVNVLIV